MYGGLLYFCNQNHKFLCISPKFNFCKYVKGSNDVLQGLWEPPEIQCTICTSV